jgi:alpha-beta hydrolase superfamily lysophospholipase
MAIELVTVRTEDGCFLDGAYWPGDGTAPARADACLLLHGATSHAFTPLMRTLAEGLAAAGVAVLSLNTRGHDIVSRMARPGSVGLGGVAFENLDEAPRDVHAGVGWLLAQGHMRVGIAGHSLGAVKCIFTQSTAALAELACVVALSPPRLAHAVQADSAAGPRFRELLDQARELVDAGRPDQLLATDVPISAYFSALQFLRKYGPEDRYDLYRHLPAIACPVLLLIGTREAVDSAAIGGAAAIAPALAATMPNLTLAIVDGADHVYTTTAATVIDTVAEWLRAPVAAGG